MKGKEIGETYMMGEISVHENDKVPCGMLEAIHICGACHRSQWQFSTLEHIHCCSCHLLEH